ncbi:hypothetical protein KNO34_05600 [Taylorella equigenitalis]|uniref:hypothetical protein n=1 Tax=Taylorella equigenitalis TaxID=29575 RepID=UPI00237CFC4C|nr:hypothetical protein [Taylorella equigenitalis]WDU48967.1 hypothetical protein KNO34_05600 [Taylorella equigenitalis]WDU51442.1 hypothetical protein KNO32_05580 [Taylorella equigenitalis]
MKINEKKDNQSQEMATKEERKCNKPSKPFSIILMEVVIEELGFLAMIILIIVLIIKGV